MQHKYSSLNQEYKGLRELYDKAMSEREPDALNKRRAFVLKSQNIQLQRHLNSIRQALESRDGFVYEVDEDLFKIRDLLKASLGSLVFFTGIDN